MVLREWRGEAFPDDEGRTGTGSVNLENRILCIVVIVIVTGYSPILCDYRKDQCPEDYVIVTRYSPILCD